MKKENTAPIIAQDLALEKFLDRVDVQDMRVGGIIKVFDGLRSDDPRTTHKLRSEGFDEVDLMCMKGWAGVRPYKKVVQRFTYDILLDEDDV